MSEHRARWPDGIVSRVGSSLAPVSVRVRGPWSRVERLRDDPARWPAYAAAVAISLGVVALLLPLREALGPVNILLLFVAVSIGTALILGSGPAAAASVFGFVVVNFLFIEPYYSISIDAPNYILALVIYLGVSLVTGQLVARLTQRTQQALREQRRVSLLYDLNTALIGDVTLDAMLDTIVQQVVTVYGSDRGRILLPVDDPASDAGDDTGTGPRELVVRATAPRSAGDRTVDRQSLAMATWAMEHRRPAGRRVAGRRLRAPHGAGRLPVVVQTIRNQDDVLYLPILDQHQVIGVLEVTGRPGGGRFSPEDERLLATFAGQAALAIDRARLAEEASRAQVLAQSDELKSALLSAVSHDLRTPLSAIKASATSLLDDQVQWRDEDRREFLLAIDEETDRLTLMVGNLLDLSRIEGGALRPDREWYDIDELVRDVATRLRHRAGSSADRIALDIEPDLPVVWFDYVEIAQVLMNLGENAIKYTPPGSPIEIRARRRGDDIELAVADHGAGIAPAIQRRLFDRFYRGSAEGTIISGSGIGLTICKGLVEAHGGRIWVESAPGHGSTFRFTLPIAPPGSADAPLPTDQEVLAR
ncbi:MAG: Osmosensitive K+ channel histidine kinase KdpD [uncultured Thermomicrobiales bacterium]|uniref:histidine kinase n=1 Tax=uncultured Thermomicrobiales bacterium TaxID=1645740 RepID=A0A6J4U6L8_9BACT|nr:MAG: Osmosensitive K+ channel histidine kinase KdpD [uncultured Thermomicrobiales bacterium]